MSTANMTAILITAPGGPEVLQPAQRPVPAAQSGEVLIRVAYAGINRHDCSQRKRGHGPQNATDIPGLEVAGEVVEVEPGVTRWKQGERVCALVNGGGYAQYCVALEALTLPIPAGYDLRQAASLPEAGASCAPKRRAACAARTSWSSASPDLQASSRRR